MLMVFLNLLYNGGKTIMVIQLTNETIEFMSWLRSFKNIDLERFSQTYDKFANVQETPLWKEWKIYLMKYHLNKDFTNA